jgi:diacylglycerol kinase
MNRPFEFAARLRSFKYAGNGVWLTLRSQHNAWIHAAATVGVVVGGVMLGISKLEWCVVILACASVWAAEAFNTALEFLADATTREVNPLVGKAKDAAAGAVLLTAIGAVCVGVLVYGHHLMALFRASR